MPATQASRRDLRRADSRDAGFASWAPFSSKHQRESGCGPPLARVVLRLAQSPNLDRPAAVTGTIALRPPVVSRRASALATQGSSGMGAICGAADDPYRPEGAVPADAAGRSLSTAGDHAMSPTGTIALAIRSALVARALATLRSSGARCSRAAASYRLRPRARVSERGAGRSVSCSGRPAAGECLGDVPILPGGPDQRRRGRSSSPSLEASLRDDTTGDRSGG
jgi:hypothetical protein